MTLLSLNEIDPRHQRTVKGKNIRQFQVYSNQGQLIGNVVDALLDSAGRFYYLIVDLQMLRSMKQVLIPIREARVALEESRIYLTGLTKTQIEQLPTYSPTHTEDFKMSENQNDTSAYSTVNSDLVLERSAPLETSMPLESVTPLEAQVVKLVNPTTPLVAAQTTSIQSASVQSAPISSPPPAVHNPSHDVLSEQTIQLLEERLFVDRHRRKVGEVIVRKEIETQIVEIPIRRETLIVEQVSPEHKQLASIDLTGGAIDGLKLAEIRDSFPSARFTTPQTTASQISASDVPSINTSFSSIEAAIEFLRSIAAQPHSNTKHVQIQLMTDGK